MAYIINVARKARRRVDIDRRHIFRTAPDSILDKRAAVEVAKQLRIAFPASEYSIEISEEHVYAEYLIWEEPSE